MAPGSSIVTDVPVSDCGDDGLSEALGSIRLDGDSTSKPSWAASLVSVGLPSLTGLNDLLECPVCTNSMWPPILQPHTSGSAVGVENLDDTLNMITRGMFGGYVNASVSANGNYSSPLVDDFF